MGRFLYVSVVGAAGKYEYNYRLPGLCASADAGFPATELCCTARRDRSGLFFLPTSMAIGAYARVQERVGVFFALGRSKRVISSVHKERRICCGHVREEQSYRLRFTAVYVQEEEDHDRRASSSMYKLFWGRDRIYTPLSTLS